MANDAARFHTVRKAAQQLGVGYSTLKRWVLAGVVRTTRTEGGHHRISDAELDRLAARHATPAPKAAPVTNDDLLGGLSARNRLRGYVEEVRVDGLLAQVRLRVGSQSLTAVITADALGALRLRRGDDAIAVIKSTEVMIATPAALSSPARRRSRPRRAAGAAGSRAATR